MEARWNSTRQLKQFIANQIFQIILPKKKQPVNMWEGIKTVGGSWHMQNEGFRQES